MRWMKIACLLVLVLALMRLCSWALGWILARVLRLNPKASAIISNLTAFLVFALLLRIDLETGEPLDTNAILFGAAVFAVYAIADLFWVPWRSRRQETAATS